MAIRIEIAKTYKDKLEVRIGDLSGSTNNINCTKEEVLSDIAMEIDELFEGGRNKNNE